MKNLVIFSLLLLFSFSCSKEITTSCNGSSESLEGETKSERMFEISLSSQVLIDTRAFFDDSSSLESWEKELKEVSLFIYKYDPDSGDKVFADRKDLTQSEIKNLRTTFAVADLEVGDQIEILATANIAIPQSVTEMEDIQMAMFGVEITDYNGTFNQVTTGAMRSEGFAMFGEAEETISDEGFTPINLLLVNLCSKVSIKLSLSDSFSEKYPGSVRVNNISVRNTPTTLYDVFGENRFDYYHLQESVALDDVFQNQFYLLYSQPIFTVDATYDEDGDFSTEEDQTPMKYKIEIKDEDGSAIILEPSTYWRIDGKINGLNGTGVVLSIVSGDWLSVKSYDIEL